LVPLDNETDVEKQSQLILAPDCALETLTIPGKIQTSRMSKRIFFFIKLIGFVPLYAV